MHFPASPLACLSPVIRVGSLLTLLLLAACGGPGDPDGGDDGGMDAGSTPHDDAGSTPDAGMDAGPTPDDDAGPTPDDDDAGDSEPDGGTEDAGPIDWCEEFEVVCDDPGPCQTVRCDLSAPTWCVTTPRADGTSCDDGNLCTQIDTCHAGVCVGSSSVTCPEPENTCMTRGECIPTTGFCSAPTARPEGMSCNSGACASGRCSVCRAGVCTPDTRLQCDGGPCVCGALSQPICTTGNACAAGLGFAFGHPAPTCVCIPGVSCGCGGAGEPCCGPGSGVSPCTFNLSCVGGMCTCGGEGQACCGPRTGEGTVCAAGTCAGSRNPSSLAFAGTCSATCGGEGQPCCTFSCPNPGPCGCGEGLACLGSTCSAACGGPGEPCCVGGGCDSGHACIEGLCSPECGTLDEPCCYLGSCEAPAFCTLGNVCRG